MDWDCTSKQILAMWWQWAPKARQSRNMPVKEGLSLLRAIQQPVDFASPRLWLTDCLPLLQAFSKGYSPSPELNQVVTTIRELLRVSKRRVLPLWIPTALMQFACDPHSRRLDSCPSFRPLHVDNFPSPVLYDFIVSQLSSKCRWHLCE